MMNILLADIVGANTRLALADASGGEIAFGRLRSA